MYCRETESRTLAVKTVFKDHIQDGIRLSKLTCELAILRRLSHENLVELVEEFNTDSLHCIVVPLHVVRPSSCRRRRVVVVSFLVAVFTTLFVYNNVYYLPTLR